MDVDQEGKGSSPARRGHAAKSWRPDGHGKYTKVSANEGKGSKTPATVASVTPVPVVVKRKKVPRVACAEPDSVTQECRRTLRNAAHAGQLIRNNRKTRTVGGDDRVPANVTRGEDGDDEAKGWKAKAAMAPRVRVRGSARPPDEPSSPTEHPCPSAPPSP